MNTLWEQYGFVNGQMDYTKSGYLRYMALLKAANERYLFADPDGGRVPFEPQQRPASFLALQDIVVACSDMQYRQGFGDVVTINDMPLMRNVYVDRWNISRLQRKSNIQSYIPRYYNYLTRTYAHIMTDSGYTDKEFCVNADREVVETKPSVSNLVSALKTRISHADLVTTSERGFWPSFYVGCSGHDSYWDISWSEIRIPYSIYYKPFNSNSEYNVGRQVISLYPISIEVSVDGRRVSREIFASTTPYVATASAEENARFQAIGILDKICQYIDRLNIPSYSERIGINAIPADIELFTAPESDIIPIVNGNPITPDMIAQGCPVYGDDDDWWVEDALAYFLYQRFDVEGGFEFY